MFKLINNFPDFIKQSDKARLQTKLADSRLRRYLREHPELQSEFMSRGMIPGHFEYSNQMGRAPNLEEFLAMNSPYMDQEFKSRLPATHEALQRFEFGLTPEQQEAMRYHRVLGSGTESDAFQISGKPFGQQGNVAIKTTVPRSDASAKSFLPPGAGTRPFDVPMLASQHSRVHVPGSYQGRPAFTAVQPMAQLTSPGIETNLLNMRKAREYRNQGDMMPDMFGSMRQHGYVANPQTGQQELKLLDYGAARPNALSPGRDPGLAPHSELEIARNVAKQRTQPVPSLLQAPKKLPITPAPFTSPAGKLDMNAARSGIQNMFGKPTPAPRLPMSMPSKAPVAAPAAPKLDPLFAGTSLLQKFLRK